MSKACYCAVCGYSVEDEIGGCELCGNKQFYWYFKSTYKCISDDPNFETTEMFEELEKNPYYDEQLSEKVFAQHANATPITYANPIADSNNTARLTRCPSCGSPDVDQSLRNVINVVLSGFVRICLIRLISQ